MTTQYEMAQQSDGGRRRTPIPDAARNVLVSVVRLVRDVNAANALLRDRIQRFDPQPENRSLHWEPTLSGWRLYGCHLPDER